MESSFFLGFCFSAVVLLVTLGLGRISWRVLGELQSALAMVAFDIMFMWAVGIAMIREGNLFFLVYS